MGHRLARFQCAQVGRIAAIEVGDIGDYRAVVQRRGTGLEAEIQVLGVIKSLNGGEAFSIGTCWKTELALVSVRMVLLRKTAPADPDANRVEPPGAL